MIEEVSQRAPAADQGPAGGQEGVRPGRRTLAWLAWAAAAYTYALIVFGGVVRITGSGLGCGDDWPRCHGHWIPPFDLPTLIEYTHRLLAAGTVLPFGALLLYGLYQVRNGGRTALLSAKSERARPASWLRAPAAAARAGQFTRGSAASAAAAAFALLLAQVLLGALTVKLELPAGATTLHFLTASLLLATLIVAAVRAAPRAAMLAEPAVPAGPARAAAAAAVLGFLVVGLGALTANTGLPAASDQPSGAALACQGFPLCNGRLLPAGGSWVLLHWTHRLLGFLLLFTMLAATRDVWRRGLPRSVRRAAAAALMLTMLQLALAAGLVLLRLPDSLRGLHLAAGVALWGALVAWAETARQAGGAGGMSGAGGAAAPA